MLGEALVEVEVEVEEDGSSMLSLISDDEEESTPLSLVESESDWLFAPQLASDMAVIINSIEVILK